MTFAAPYGKLLGMLEKEFVEAVEGMPEDKFNFAPPEGSGDFKGVRTFAGQVKHVTGSTYYFFGGRGMTLDAVKAKEDSVEKLATKAETVQALKDSLKNAHAFIDGMTAENAYVTMPNGGTRAGMVLVRYRPHDGSLRPAGRLSAHERDRTPRQPRIHVTRRIGCHLVVCRSLRLRDSEIWNFTQRLRFPQRVEGFSVVPGRGEAPR